MNKKIEKQTLRKIFAIVIRFIFGLVRFHKRKNKNSEETE
jgi:hypothetical protein